MILADAVVGARWLEQTGAEGMPKQWRDCLNATVIRALIAQRLQITFGFAIALVSVLVLGLHALHVAPSLVSALGLHGLDTPAWVRLLDTATHSLTKGAISMALGMALLWLQSAWAARIVYRANRLSSSSGTPLQSSSGATSANQWQLTPHRYRAWQCGLQAGPARVQSRHGRRA